MIVYFSFAWNACSDGLIDSVHTGMLHLENIKFIEAQENARNNKKWNGSLVCIGRVVGFDSF